MSTQYTIEHTPDIVFLNHGNIAQSVADIDRIEYNAIPSLSLMIKEDKSLSDYIHRLELSANSMSTDVNAISNDIVGQISNHDRFLSGSIQTLSVNLSTDINSISGKIYEDFKYGDNAQKQLTEGLSGEVNSISGQIYEDLGKGLKQISAEAAISAEHYADMNFIKYESVGFKYLQGPHHALVISYTNNDNSTTSISVDATNFIKSGIIDHIEIIGDNLFIYYKKADGSYDRVEIPVNKWMQFYTGAEGIKITPSDSQDTFIISCDSTIARSAEVTNSLIQLRTELTGSMHSISTDLTGQIDDLDAKVFGQMSELSTSLSTQLTGWTTEAIASSEQMLSGDYVSKINSLSVDHEGKITAVSTDYISKSKDTVTNQGVVTKYRIDAEKNGGIEVGMAGDNESFPYSTYYRADSIKVVRLDTAEYQLFTYRQDEDGNRILREKDLRNIITKAELYAILKKIKPDSPYSDVLDVLIKIRNLVDPNYVEP